MADALRVDDSLWWEVLLKRNEEEEKPDELTDKERERLKDWKDAQESEREFDEYYDEDVDYAGLGYSPDRERPLEDHERGEGDDDEEEELTATGGDADPKKDLSLDSEKQAEYAGEQREEGRLAKRRSEMTGRELMDAESIDAIMSADELYSGDVLHPKQVAAMDDDTEYEHVSSTFARNIASDIEGGRTDDSIRHLLGAMMLPAHLVREKGKSRFKAGLALKSFMKLFSETHRPATAIERLETGQRFVERESDNIPEEFFEEGTPQYRRRQREIQRTHRPDPTWKMEPGADPKEQPHIPLNIYEDLIEMKIPEIGYGKGRTGLDTPLAGTVDPHTRDKENKKPGWIPMRSINAFDDPDTARDELLSRLHATTDNARTRARWEKMDGSQILREYLASGGKSKPLSDLMKTSALEEIKRFIGDDEGKGGEIAEAMDSFIKHFHPTATPEEMEKHREELFMNMHDVYGSNVKDALDRGASRQSLVNAMSRAYQALQGQYEGRRHRGAVPKKIDLMRETLDAHGNGLAWLDGHSIHPSMLDHRHHEPWGALDFDTLMGKAEGMNPGDSLHSLLSENPDAENSSLLRDLRQYVKDGDEETVRMILGRLRGIDKGELFGQNRFGLHGYTCPQCENGGHSLFYNSDPKHGGHRRFVKGPRSLTAAEHAIRDGKQIQLQGENEMSHLRDLLNNPRLPEATRSKVESLLAEREMEFAQRDIINDMREQEGAIPDVSVSPDEELSEEHHPDVEFTGGHDDDDINREKEQLLSEEDWLDNLYSPNIPVSRYPAGPHERSLHRGHATNRDPTGRRDRYVEGYHYPEQVENLKKLTEQITEAFRHDHTPIEKRIEKLRKQKGKAKTDSNRHELDLQIKDYEDLFARARQLGDVHQGTKRVKGVVHDGKFLREGTSAYNKAVLAMGSDKADKATTWRDTREFSNHAMAKRKGKDWVHTLGRGELSKLKTLSKKRMEEYHDQQDARFERPTRESAGSIWSYEFFPTISAVHGRGRDSYKDGAGKRWFDHWVSSPTLIARAGAGEDDYRAHVNAAMNNSLDRGVGKKLDFFGDDGIWHLRRERNPEVRDLFRQVSREVLDRLVNPETWSRRLKAQAVGSRPQAYHNPTGGVTKCTTCAGHGFIGGEKARDILIERTDEINRGSPSDAVERAIDRNFTPYGDFDSFSDQWDSENQHLGRKDAFSAYGSHISCPDCMDDEGYSLGICGACTGRGNLAEGTAAAERMHEIAKQIHEVIPAEDFRLSAIQAMSGYGEVPDEQLLREGEQPPFLAPEGNPALERLVTQMTLRHARGDSSAVIAQEIEALKNSMSMGDLERQKRALTISGGSGVRRQRELARIARGESHFDATMFGGEDFSDEGAPDDDEDESLLDELKRLGREGLQPPSLSEPSKEDDEFKDYRWQNILPQLYDKDYELLDVPLIGGHSVYDLGLHLEPRIGAGGNKPKPPAWLMTPSEFRATLPSDMSKTEMEERVKNHARQRMHMMSKYGGDREYPYLPSQSFGPAGARVKDYAPKVSYTKDGWGLSGIEEGSPYKEADMDRHLDILDGHTVLTDRFAQVAAGGSDPLQESDPIFGVVHSGSEMYPYYHEYLGIPEGSNPGLRVLGEDENAILQPVPLSPEHYAQYSKIHSSLLAGEDPGVHEIPVSFRRDENGVPSEIWRQVYPHMEDIHPERIGAEHRQKMGEWMAWKAKYFPSTLMGLTHGEQPGNELPIFRWSDSTAADVRGMIRDYHGVDANRIMQPYIGQQQQQQPDDPNVEPMEKAWNHLLDRAGVIENLVSFL